MQHSVTTNLFYFFPEEELKFFEGNSSCKGKVRIEKFDGTEPDWLPAKPVEENKKKATDICSAMQCGSLVSFETEQNTTYAKVTCSGTVHVPSKCLFNLLLLKKIIIIFVDINWVVGL